MKRKLWFYSIVSIVILTMLSNCHIKKENDIPATVMDIDSNVYHTVTIGNQVWMKENLKVTHYRNGNPLPNIPDDTLWCKLEIGAYCNYNNDSSNGTTYGHLYNWYAINDSRNIAPIGWHISSWQEWDNVIKYLGGELIAGGKMKEAGIEHWASPNERANNISGLSGLPGGRHDKFGYQDLTLVGYYWSSPEFSITGGCFKLLLYNLDGIGQSCGGYKYSGYSVRCVMD